MNVMKKIIALTITLVLVLSLASLSAFTASAASTAVDVWDGTTAAGFSSGSGIESDPYIIKTGAELDLLASTCYGGETYANTYFRLEADIDWAGNLWTPIGYDSSHLFSGHFDGNGQTIYNLECFEPYSGIFGAIKEGSVKNLKVDYASFTTDTRYCGAVVAWMKLSTVQGVTAGENVVVKTADIMSNTAQMGGCFGIVHSSAVEGATFYGKVECTTVTGTSFIGGIAGVVGGEGSMKYCVNYGSVNNINPPTIADAVCYVGGVSGCVGASSDIGTIEYCVNYGDVSSVDVAGGVTGRVHVSNSVMKNCFNLGKVEAVRAGTVLGYLSKPYVMEGNGGVTSASATAAIGDAPGSDDAAYKAPTDANLAVMSEASITSSMSFNEALGRMGMLMPTFNTVTPVEAQETTEEVTTEEITEDAPVVTDAPSDSQTTEEEQTDAPVATDAPANNTAAATDPAPAEKKGCGGTIGLAAVLVCIIPVAFFSKKQK